MRIVKMLALGLGMLAFSGATLRADSLVLTGNYNSIPFSTGTVGGGSLAGATLNGVALPWLYCVQLTIDVNVPNTYPNTIVDYTGVIHNSGTQPDSGSAGKIAWLLSNYADGANTNQQIALQAAIWNVEGFGSLQTNNATLNDLYNSMLENVGSGDVSQYAWLTPGNAQDSHQFQGLVTRVPDGGMTLMLLGSALVGLAGLRRKFRA